MVLVPTHDGKYAPAQTPVKPWIGVGINPAYAKKLVDKFGEGSVRATWRSTPGFFNSMTTSPDRSGLTTPTGFGRYFKSSAIVANCSIAVSKSSVISWGQ